MDKIGRIVERLAADWAERPPYAGLTGDLAPADLAEAYRAQAALQARLAEARGPIAGRKIALSSKPMQEMVGIGHPVAGAFFAADIRQSPAEVRLAEFRRLGVEFELALELARDVPPQAAPHDRESVRGLIGGVRPAFELVEDFAADYATLDALSLVASNAWCGGVVLGEPVAGWQELDLADMPATVRQAGREPERVNTGAADPLGSLAWVLNHCAGQGITVGAGEHVITGSATRTRFPTAGDRFRYEIDGRAAVEMTLV